MNNSLIDVVAPIILDSREINKGKMVLSSFEVGQKCECQNQFLKLCQGAFIEGIIWLNILVESSNFKVSTFNNSLIY